MKHNEFIHALDDARITAAIQAAEAKSTGEIRVFISTGHCDDALVAARKQFERLGLAKTKNRNGVLIFIAPKSQNFAVLGDEAIHACLGDETWSSIRDVMLEHFQHGDHTGALLAAITRVGEALARHFPCTTPATNPNELPDKIERD